MTKTREEYEERKQRLEAQIEAARQEFVAARSRLDRLYEDARQLRYDWQEQQRNGDGR